MLTTAFFNHSWSYSQEKSQKNLHSHSSLLFQMLAVFLNLFIMVDSRLLVKASGGVPQGQLCQFGFHDLIFLSLSMVRGWLSRS